MLAAAKTVSEHAAGVRQSDFHAGSLEYDASLTQLMVLAEAANRVPPEVRDRLNTVAWNKIRGLRNRIAHDYEGLNNDTVWNTVTVIVPKLVATLSEVLAKHGGE